MSTVSLKIIKKSEEVDANNKVGVTMVGGTEEVDNGLGIQMADRYFWSKVDNSFELNHVFADVDLDKFHKRQGDEGMTFLTPVVEA